MRAYLHFVRLIRKELYGAIVGIFMSFIASFSSIALMGTATWFLSAMAIAGFYDYALNIFIPSALIRLLALLRTILRYAERYYTHDATFRILAYLRVFLFERALDLRLEDALKLKSSDLQRRLLADLDRIEVIYVRQFVPFVCAVLLGLIVGGVLLSYSWLLAAVVLILMVFASVIVPVVATRLAKDASSAQSRLGVNLNDEINELIHGFFDLMLLGKHYEQAQRFLATSQLLAKARAKVIFFDQLSQVFLLFCAELTCLLVLVICVPLVSNGTMSAPVMMLLAVGSMAAYEFLVPLSAAFLSLPYVAYSAQRISDLLQITNQSALDDKVTRLLQSDDMAKAEQVYLKSFKEQSQQLSSISSLKLDKVSFAYHAAEQMPILQDCSLEFSTAQNYVIKAPSGRGKTTLVMLISNLLYPQSGEISLDGIPYRQLNSREIRSRFAVALQDITLFSGSILESFKQVRPCVSKEEIDTVLDIVELTDLVATLPNGLEEWLGSTGLSISGGQARRLCVARALLVFMYGSSKREVKPDFLILDEPGEGLDIEQELRIIERIQQLSKGVIIITHKQAGLRLADQVLEL